MPDFGDKSLESAELFLGVALANRVKDAQESNNKLRPQGHCHHCAEKVEDLKIFCDSECARDYDRERWLRGQHVKADKE